MVETKVWAWLRRTVSIAADGCDEVWCVNLLAAFKAATEEHVKAQAIGAAWKALARAERAFAGAQTFGDHDAKGRAFQAIAAATAALRALGVDPDAADEPGQVQP